MKFRELFRSLSSGGEVAIEREEYQNIDGREERAGRMLSRNRGLETKRRCGREARNHEGTNTLRQLTCSTYKGHLEKTQTL